LGIAAIQLGRRLHDIVALNRHLCSFSFYF